MQAVLELLQLVQRVDLNLIAVVADVNAEVLPGDQLTVQAAVEDLLVQVFSHIHQFGDHETTVRARIVHDAFDGLLSLI